MLDQVDNKASESEEVYAFPASFSQESLWFLEQLDPGSPVYIMRCSIRRHGALDFRALKHGLDAVVRRHDSLRTTFSMLDGQLTQIITPELSLSLPVHDLQSLPDLEREDEALGLATAAARQPFDLEHGPLLRVELLRLRPDMHILLITMHHIISDGTSMNVLLDELMTCYEAYAEEREPELPELPIQYPDYAVWQRDRLAQGRLDSQLAYWRHQLHEAPALLDLPTDFPRRHAHSWQGAMRPFALDRELTEQIRQLAQEHGVTLYMTLLASLSALFARLSGQDDILVGAPVIGRNQVETEPLIGMLLNTLVMRTDVGGDPTFRELLGRVREVSLEAHAHQELPFEYLVRELHPDRLPAQNPFFQVMLTYWEMPTLPAGWSLAHLDIETETAKFDLNIEVDDRPDGFIGRWEYRTELFLPQTIERWLGHWQLLLAAAVAHPDLPLSQLPLLSPLERQHLLQTWQPARSPSGEAALGEAALPSIPERFADQVQRSPDAIAVTDGKQELTYAQLAHRARLLAAQLRHAGLQPGEYVGLCLERSVGVLVGILGIWQAGGAYVPVELEWPAARQVEVLTDSGARLVVSQWTVAGRVAPGAWQVLTVPELTDDQDSPQDSGESDQDSTQAGALAGTLAERVAYLLYTSGSTGTPKGVMVTHANISRLFQATEDWYHFSARDVWTMFHSYAFDFSVWEMWGALLYGGRLVVVPYLTSRNPRAFYNLLQAEQVTVLNQTPSAFRQLIQVDQTAKEDSSLRYVIFGGEALDAQMLAPWFARHGDRQPQLVNMYGITETTVHVSYYPLSREDAETDRGSLVGRPIPDLYVYILDQHRQPVPIGIKGELYVGGLGLALGYLNRPELTAERFIADPFVATDGARIYKTGDLGRYLPDGTIEYLGRADQQVKLRGFRIELGEIEARLRQHPGVQDAVVLPFEGNRQDRLDGRLAAYVIPERMGIVTGHQLKEFLRIYLPDYMVPAGFVMLEALPLTSNGKLDRKALPPPESNAERGETTFGAATLSLHHQLIQIWEDLLGVHPISIDDDFFDLGGHSLLAVQLVNRIEQVSGKRIPLTTLFAGATVAQLSRVILEDGAVAARSHVVALQEGTTNRPFFFLHGDWDGGGFYSLDLARHLGENQPFYVLDHPADDASLVESPTIQALASTHVKALREIQPEGPYRLGGFCIGGLIAFEMAQQMQGSGEVVEMLALIDAEPAHWELRLAHRFLGALGAVIPSIAERRFNWFTRFRHFAGLFRRGMRQIPEWRSRAWTFLKSFISNRLRLEQIFQRTRVTLHSLSPAASETAAQRWLGLYTWAAAGYVPHRYPSRITLIWAEEDLPKNKRNPAKWCKQVAQSVDLLTVPGSHLTCITTHVHELAATLRTSLDRIGAVWPQSVSVRGQPGLERYRELPRVSVVIPALNEAKNLPHVLPNLPTCVTEAILVDGHSNDGTAEVARRLRQDVKIVHQTGRGKGDALRCGFEASSGDIVVMMDADGSTNPYEIMGFVDALLSGADYAKGSRFIMPGGSDDLTLLRRLGNHVLRRLVNHLYAVQFTDLCYGYNAFWRHGLSSLEADRDGFEIETLLSLRAVKKGLKIVEVPSYEYSRIHGESHLRVVRDGWRVLMTILGERQGSSLPVKRQFGPQSRLAAALRRPEAATPCL